MCVFRLGGTAKIGAEVDHGGRVVPGRPVASLDALRAPATAGCGRVAGDPRRRGRCAGRSGLAARDARAAGDHRAAVHRVWDAGAGARPGAGRARPRLQPPRRRPGRRPSAGPPATARPMGSVAGAVDDVPAGHGTVPHGRDTGVFDRRRRARRRDSDAGGPAGVRGRAGRGRWARAGVAPSERRREVARAVGRGGAAGARRRPCGDARGGERPGRHGDRVRNYAGSGGAASHPADRGQQADAAVGSRRAVPGVELPAGRRLGAGVLPVDQPVEFCTRC